MIEGVPGQPLLVELQLIDEVAGKYPQAVIYNNAGTVSATLDMLDRGAGFYQVEWAAPTAGHYSALFFVYEDALHTTRTDHELGLEHLRIFQNADEPVEDPPGSGTINEAIMQAAYDGVITIDTKNGTAGTAWPKGTRWDPVSNLADGLTIAAARNLRRFDLRGNMTLTSALPDWVVVGIGEEAEINLNGQDVADSEFENLVVSGTIGTAPLTLRDCVLDGIADFEGTAKDCALRPAEITLSGNARFVNCSSAVPGLGTPAINMNGTGRNLEMRNYVGGILISNLTGVADRISIDQVAGQVVLNNTNTAGTVAIRGVGNLTDNSGAGCTVVETAHLDRPRIADAIWDEDPAEHVADDTFGQSILRLLAHHGENVRDFLDTPDANGRPLAARRRVYLNRADALANTNHILELEVTASYSGVPWDDLVRTVKP